MSALKIAIIGAGSAQFSGGIIRDLCVTKNLHGTRVVLMDIDLHRLQMITEMGQKLCRELGANLVIESTADRREALIGADFVINTAQDQGESWAMRQRELAMKHHCDGLMLTYGLYQSAFLLEVARDMEKYCPNATLIQSSNPVFEGCTVITRETGIRTIGLCHGHYGYRDIVRVLGLDPQKVSARMYGFNHWIWMTDFRYEGKDAYPILDKWIETDAEAYWKLPKKYSDQQMSRASIDQYRLFGLMPIGDTPRGGGMVSWIYNDTLEHKKEWYSQQGGFDSAQGWAEYQADLKQNLDNIEMCASDPEKRVTDVFPPVQSDEQIVPIIESLVCDISRKYQVNIPNHGGLVEGVPDDIVVECEAVISGAGINGLHMGRLPARVMAGAMYPRMTQAEIICEAVSHPSREAVELAFLMARGARSRDDVNAMIDEWLAEERNARYANMIRDAKKH